MATTKKCKFCQTEIAKEAKICPNCKKDLRSWFRRHPVISILGTVFLFFIILGTASPAGKEGYKAGSNTAASNETTASSKKEQKITPLSPKDLMATNNPDVKHLTTFTADYVGKSFTLYAYAKTDKYYNYGFDDEKNYLCLSLKDESAGIFGEVYAYMDRNNAENKQLAEDILNKQGFYKFNVTIPANKYREGSNAFLYIASWEKI